MKKQHANPARPSPFETFLAGSFDATAVLIFGLPDSPYAQPRNVLGGQIIAVTFYKLVPDTVWLASALAVSTTVVLMHYFRMIHPPGGATALIAVIGGGKVHGPSSSPPCSPVRC